MMMLERPVLYRERAARTYSSIVYHLGIVLREVPFTILSTITFGYACLEELNPYFSEQTLNYFNVIM